MQKVAPRIVSLSPISLEIGSMPSIVIESGIFLENVSAVQWAISRVGPDFTELAIASSSVPRKEGNNWRCDCKAASNLEPGLYCLTGLRFYRNQEISPASPGEAIDPSLCLFEIRSQNTPARTYPELIAAYKSLAEAQKTEFMRGIGSGRERFRVFVFIRNLLITRKMRLLRYEVIPIQGFSCETECGVIEQFFRNNGFPNVTVPARLRREAETRQPAIVVHFPVVHADDSNMAKNTAEREAALLARLLTLHRGGAGSVFGSVAVLPDGVTLDFRIKVAPYPGNLLGGVLSGEDPRHISDRMQRLRRSEALQLYCSLFWEALREPNVELQYFRYWNLLETVARAKELEGEPKRDWSGSVVINRKGKTQKITTASELVFELLRRVLPPRHIGESSYASNLCQGLLSQQVPIWYRRRNCAVHGGGCLCRNPNLRCRGTQYVNCRAAREEATNAGFDWYLRSLQDVTESILASELDTDERLG